MKQSYTLSYAFDEIHAIIRRHFKFPVSDERSRSIFTVPGDTAILSHDKNTCGTIDIEKRGENQTRLHAVIQPPSDDDALAYFARKTLYPKSYGDLAFCDDPAKIEDGLKKFLELPQIEIALRLWAGCGWDDLTKETQADIGEDKTLQFKRMVSTDQPDYPRIKAVWVGIVDARDELAELRIKKMEMIFQDLEKYLASSASTGLNRGLYPQLTKTQPDTFSAKHKNTRISTRLEKVAELSKSGYTQKEIAEKLSVSIRTITNDLQRINSLKQ